MATIKNTPISAGDSENNELLTAALEYAAAGFPVFPLHTPNGKQCDCSRGNACTSPGKHPRTKNGLKEATTDEPAIRAWWKRWPEANIAMVIPEGYVAVDIDGPAGWESIRDASGGDLPRTASQRTGKGAHAIYRTAQPIRQRGGFLPGVDLRSNGDGYVVVAPSLHANGTRYEWVQAFGTFADAPGWLSNANTGSSVRTDISTDESTVRTAISEGGRNTALTSLAGKMRHAGFDADAILEALSIHNATHCNPPLDDAEVANIAKSIGRYEAGPDQDSHKDDEPESIGSWTAFDLPYGPAPDPLVPPFLTQDEATLIYAKGGTGKGLIACWLLMQLVRRGHTVMVLDSEGHRREWGSRLRAMGLTDDELMKIHYRSPSSDSWTSPTATLTEAQDLLKADCDARGVTVLLVDSYTYAADPGAELGGAEPAKRFFDSAKRIGRHTIVLAHTTGNAGRFPARPFGSVHVINGPREAWAVEKVEGEQIEYDPSAAPLQPAVVALEMRCTKMSERSDTVPPQFINFSFFHDGHIEVDHPEKTRNHTTVSDLINESLDSPMTISQIAKAIKEDTGETPNEETIKKALGRDKRFQVVSTSRPRKWDRVK